ncbi:MAG: hypothetical protein R2795_13935 [Saprospiraceae bacterium]
MIIFKGHQFFFDLLCGKFKASGMLLPFCRAGTAALDQIAFQNIFYLLDTVVIIPASSLQSFARLHAVFDVIFQHTLALTLANTGFVKR